MSLKLDERKIEIDGTVYPLRCNMSVLERLQDGPGEGSIGSLMNRESYQVIFFILNAMIEDACEDDPSLPPVPMKRLKKLFSPAQLGQIGIFHMFVDSLSITGPISGAVPDSDTTEEPKTPDVSGN